MGQVENDKNVQDDIRERSRVEDKKLEQVSGGRYEYPKSNSDSPASKMIIGRPEKEDQSGDCLAGSVVHS